MPLSHIKAEVTKTSGCLFIATVLPAAALAQVRTLRHSPTHVSVSVSIYLWVSPVSQIHNAPVLFLLLLLLFLLVFQNITHPAALSNMSRSIKARSTCAGTDRGGAVLCGSVGGTLMCCRTGETNYRSVMNFLTSSWVISAYVKTLRYR